MTAVKEITVEKEKRRRIDRIWWAGSFIIAGLVFLAREFDVLPELGPRGDEWWIWVALGLGVWSLLLNILRVVLQDWPKPRPWDYIWTVIFLGVGLGAITDFQISGGTIAGVVLVAIGVISLARIFSSSN